MSIDLTRGLFGQSSDGEASGERKRLPPGQRLTDGWPILHYGGIPRVDLDSWEFMIGGLVDNEVKLSWDQFMALPQVEVRTDIHCVTTWSKYDNDWAGVRFTDVMELANVRPEAKHVMFHSYGGYTTNVPLSELMAPGVFREERWGEGEMSRPVYFFDLFGDTVWGATAALLRQLLARLTDTDPGGLTDLDPARGVDLVHYPLGPDGLGSVV